MPGWKLGVIVGLEEGAAQALGKVQALGLPTCQLGCWRTALYTAENAATVRRVAGELGIEITTLWAGTPGRLVWNFLEGPLTIGLVPPETRAERLAALKRGADFAAQLGLASITTHVGFIPEDPNDARYAAVVAALRDLAGYCAGLGLEFWFETGQETPVTLLRTIQDVGTGNLGINLDPANLLLYGKANPVDALDVFGRYVHSLHAKDGEYPTDGRSLGEEKPLGAGRVNFPALLARLKDLGFAGHIAIEREISGPRQAEDIRRAKELLEGIMAGLWADKGATRRAAGS